MDLLFGILALIIELIFKVAEFIVNMLKIVGKMILKKIDELSSNEKKLFIFGMPHSGKSTITAALVNYLTDNEEYTFRRDPIKNKDGVNVIREWSKDLREGKFPLQTPKGEYTKVHLEYQHGSSEINRLVTYEIAGEDVIKFDPTHDDYNSISELTAFLRSSNGIIILASSKPDNTSFEAEILQDFLELLLRKYSYKPVCFILTKFDLIENEYENHVQAAKVLYPGALKLLLQHHKSTVLSFSVGSVSDCNNQITKFSNKDVKSFFRWIKEL